MLTLNDIERNSELAPIQWGYTPAGFFARKLMPVVQVTKPSGKYLKFDAKHLRYIKSISEGGAKAPSVDIGASLSDYKCLDHPRSVFISDKMSREMGNDIAIPFSQMTQDSLLVEEERDLSTALNTTANFAYSNYLTPATLWNAAGADPWAGATTSVSAGLTFLYAYNGNRVNDIIMCVTPDVDLILADFARASIATPMYDLPDAAAMARYFKVREYVVLTSAYNSSIRGQADSLAGCFGTKQCWLLNVPAENNLMVPSFGKTIVDTAGSFVDQEVQKDPRGDKLILTNSYDQETIDFHLAYWIKDCIS
jgi:hypothetical protein